MTRRPADRPVLPYFTPGMLPDRPSPAVRGQVAARGRGYWTGLRRDGRLPARRDLDPAALCGLLPQAMLLDVARRPWDFRFRLIGGNLLYHLGVDWTGRWMSELPETRPPNPLFEQCCAVARSGRPFSDRTPFAGWHHGVRQADGVILPLARDGRRADALLLFVEFVADDVSSRRPSPSRSG